MSAEERLRSFADSEVPPRTPVDVLQARIHRRRRRRFVRTAAAVVILTGVALAVASGRGSEHLDTVDEPTPTTVEPSTSSTTATTATTEATTSTAETGPAPTGLPDPQTVIGLDMYRVQEAPGVWRVFIGGHPTELAAQSASCFQRPARDGDPCPYALEALYAGGSAGPTLADSALLLLLQLRSRQADGTPIWMIVDGVITRTPDGEPEWLNLCDGEGAVAFYGSATLTSGRYVATVAWSPNPDATALQTVDPASITCYYNGE